MTDRETLAAALSFDPLLEAEKTTGKSYKDDPETMRLGIGLAMLHNQTKESTLRERADSYYSMDFAGQLALFADLGFAEVLRDTFCGTDGPESFVVLWHPDGLLATCESYNQTRRNSAKVYYNYQHQDGCPDFRLTSSGHLNGNTWVGDHDAREGVRHNLNALRAEGRFLPVWDESPFLWLLTYAEVKVDGYDYESINAARIARLPLNVQVAICGAAEAEVA